MPPQDTVRRDLWKDAFCIVLVTLVSALPYIGRIGFYSDDWGLFADQDIHGWTGVFGNFPGRPLQALQSALLFSAFGWRPLGYHIVTTAVIAGCGVLLYRLLVRLQAGRELSFSATLLFLLLPQLSTVRVWIAAAQVPLSLAFALASLHAQLTFAQKGRPGALILAAICAILTLGLYETFTPLTAGFALTLLWKQRQDRRAIAGVAAIAALMMLAILYKVLSSGRAGEITDVHRYLAGAARFVSPAYDWRVDSSLNAFAALDVYFWLTLKNWAVSLLTVASGRSSAAAILAASIIAALTYWRLRRTDARTFRAGRLFLLGAAAFVLGHATFLIVPSILFSPTGLANRVSVAGAIGIAMIFAAAVGCASRVVPRAFAAAMAILAAAATLWIERIETYWAEAPALQWRIIENARSDLRGLPTGSTVILDGVCPYHGPAVVFEAPWDVGGALSWAFRRTINGDTVSPRMSLKANGLLTSIYKQPAFYRYGPTLYAYNPNLRLAVPLTSEEAARDYFGRPGRWPQRCAPGFVGHGALI